MQPEQASNANEANKTNEANDTQRAGEARVHIKSINAAVCMETVAHHSYWAWHFAQKITDERLRAQVQAELQTAERAKEA